MAKRGPQSALNHLNWDEEEKTEEVGEFAKASEDVLKQRVIKKARRRMDGPADADSTAAPASSSIFGAFKGFAPAPAAKSEDAGTNTAPKPFSFLAGLATGAAKPNGNTAAAATAVSSSGSSLTSTTAMFSFGSNAGTTLADASKKFTFGSPASLQSADKGSSETGAGSKPSTGFSFLSPKAGTESSNKNLFGMVSPSTFSFGAAAVTKADAATTPSTTSVSSPGSETKSTFSFGSVGGAKKDETGVKPTFSFGSIPSPTATKAADSSTKSDPPASTKDDSKAPAEKKATYTFGMPADSKENVPLAAAKPSFSFGTAKESSAETVKKMFSFMDNKAPAGDADASKKTTFSFGTLPQKKDDGADDGKKPSTGFSFGTLPKPASSSADTTDAAAKKTVFGGFGTTPTKEPAGSVEGTKKTFSFGSLPPKEPPSPVATKSSPFGGFAGTTFGAKPATTDKSKEDEFKSHVVSLNKCFVTWITQNVEKNPFCKLHLVFRDYEKHFAKLEGDKAPSTTSISSSTISKSDAKPAEQKDKAEEKKKEEATIDKPKEVAKPMFSFGSLPKEPLAKVSAPAPGGFTFGASKPFSFGSPLGGIGSTTAASNRPTTSTPASTFSSSFFAGASTFASKPAATTGFTFGNVAPPAATESKPAEGGDGGEDADDEPPKVEFTPVEEKDSVYSKRCKLFVKVGGNYSDRGIGTVHIKLVDTKVQVLVRADTSLGNVLLNIILNESIPLQRMGKNNVMMICLPTPDSKPPPTSVLLRVKTAEEADELFETLKKHKSK
ncbi:nuclear pore complex protein Nup50 [Anopheles aquasalis]|uniref:nuclear pore complex protein Nup50 n=1 Tax=Anopheles aquasalis TaxID=42839 RepID=UPI00215A77C4|nr:nuclear pore complex protein Nup50 [Anopheles aquasalis]